MLTPLLIIGGIVGHGAWLGLRLHVLRPALEIHAIGHALVGIPFALGLFIVRACAVS